MGRITGRPKKAITREKNIGFFVTRAQYLIIQNKAKKADVNISDYMRKVAVFGEVVTRWTAEERVLFKELVSISNGFHELVQIARREGALHGMLYFKQYRDLIDGVIKRLGESPVKNKKS